MSRVLIVDPQLTGRLVLEKFASRLEGATWVDVCGDASAALKSAADATPDLVLVDIRIDGLGAEAFLRRFRALRGCGEVPVLVVGAREDANLVRAVCEADVTDWLTSPVEFDEFRVRCRNLLTIRTQQQMLQDRTEWLSRKVRESTDAIRIREHDTLLRLAKAGEYRDQDTGDHVIRMARYSSLIGEALGLDEEERSVLELAAPLHDIGKIGVSDELLRLPRRLTEKEFESVKSHTLIGYEILKGSPSKFLQAGAVIALCHHERFDGKGYPGGLQGVEIPLRARIVTVADVYDALATPRPYKGAWSHQEALAEIECDRGTRFDPECVDAFRAVAERIKRIREEVTADCLLEKGHWCTWSSRQGIAP